MIFYRMAGHNPGLLLVTHASTQAAYLLACPNGKETWKACCLLFHKDTYATFPGLSALHVQTVFDMATMI